MKSCESPLQSCIKLSIWFISPFYVYFIAPPRSWFIYRYIDAYWCIVLHEKICRDLIKKKKITNSEEVLLCIVDPSTCSNTYPDMVGEALFLGEHKHLTKHESGRFQYIKFGTSTFEGVHCCFLILFFSYKKYEYVLYKNIFCIKYEYILYKKWQDWLEHKVSSLC